MIVRKQRGRFECAETLHPQRFAERVDFEQHFAKRVVRARAAGANRVIAFAQRRQQIAHRLQRMDDVIARGRNESGAQRRRLRASASIELCR